MATAEVAPPVGNDGVYLYRVAEDIDDIHYRLGIFQEALRRNAPALTPLRRAEAEKAAHNLILAAKWLQVASKKLYKAAVNADALS
jgi:hypothetical protein